MSLPANIEHEYFKTNGIRLHAAAAGPEDGPLVILLHGFPEFWGAWKQQIPALARAGYRVLAPDQRGYNLSDKPAGVAPYNLDALADDVIGLIDACGRERAFLVGHDWGGAVAWWVANKYPQRLEKLAVLNVPHNAVMKRHVRRNRAQMRKSWYMLFFQIPWLPERLMRANNWRVSAGSLTATSRPGTFSMEDLDDYRRAWSQPGVVTAMVNWYRALLRQQPGRLASPRIKVPTLLIWGAGDNFLGLEMAEPSIAMCDDGQLVMLENATHWVHHELPEHVNTLLLGHFAGQADR